LGEVRDKIRALEDGKQQQAREDLRAADEAETLAHAMLRENESSVGKAA
jgi:hypothetical protein